MPESNLNGGVTSYRITKKPTLCCVLSHAFMFVNKSKNKSVTEKCNSIYISITMSPFCFVVCVWHSGFIAFMTFLKELINKIVVTVVFATLLLFCFYETL